MMIFIGYRISCCNHKAFNFWHQSSLRIFLFPCYSRYRIPRALVHGDVKYTGWEKLAIFDGNRCLPKKRYTRQVHIYYGALIGSHPIDSCRFRWPTSSDLENQDARDPFSRQISVSTKRSERDNISVGRPIDLSGQSVRSAIGVQTVQ